MGCRTACKIPAALDGHPSVTESSGNLYIPLTPGASDLGIFHPGHRALLSGSFSPGPSAPRGPKPLRPSARRPNPPDLLPRCGLPFPHERSGRCEIEKPKGWPRAYPPGGQPFPLVPHPRGSTYLQNLSIGTPTSVTGQ
jgi:hypothetical protein